MGLQDNKSLLIGQSLFGSLVNDKSKQKITEVITECPISSGHLAELMRDLKNHTKAYLCGYEYIYQICNTTDIELIEVSCSSWNRRW